MTVDLIQGDCLDVMKSMSDNSVDSVVTDPPYELGFMGKAWDRSGIAFNPDVWGECLRVLKPGGHLLAFGGSRTYHRIACAIEDAGFEIRDQIMWLYGSGFPKSHNIGKAIKAKEETGGSAPRNLRMARMGIYYKPTGQKDYRRGRMFESLPSDDLADEVNNVWDGWGTALKPAHEPICVARKPFDGTVADNVLEWGTGGINIDGCRVELAEHDNDLARCNKTDNGMFGVGNNNNNKAQILKDAGLPPVGRFPANVIHDGSEEVLAGFPKQAGASAPSSGKTAGQMGQNGIYGGASGEGWADGSKSAFYGDSGSAARFFYCAKASRSERNAGLEGMAFGEPPASARSKPAEGRKNALGYPRQNHHPTVKPIALMRYLCKLVTPPGGIVLDPFTGSGTTGCGAVLEGFGFIGIDLEAEYIEIARRRIDYWNMQPRLI